MHDEILQPTTLINAEIKVFPVWRPPSWDLQLKTTSGDVSYSTVVSGTPENMGIAVGISLIAASLHLHPEITWGNLIIQLTGVKPWTFYLCTSWLQEMSASVAMYVAELTCFLLTHSLLH